MVLVVASYQGNVADPALTPPGRVVVVGADGGLPGYIMFGAGGQALKATDDPLNPGLNVRWDTQTLEALDMRLAQLAKSITDSCAAGLRVSASTVTDQTVNSTAVAVPIRSDGGLAYDDPTLVQIDVQNVSTAGKSLRCAYTNVSTAVAATCSKGTRLDPGAMGSFPARYPDHLSCVCCLTMAGTATNGCVAASSVVLCVQPTES